MSRPKVLVGILFAVFMAAVEATVVATAMPSVIASLGGVALYGWVTAAYLLASTVTVPIYGKLSDLRGRKPVILFGIAMFLVGSVATGAAGTTEFLIFARVIQGLGAGAIQPVALTMVGDMYSIEERGKIQAWLGSIWAIAGAAGPLLGGFFVDVLSWRWVFWFNVPFGIIAAIILTKHFKDAENERLPLKLDWLGAFALTAVSVAVLLIAEKRVLAASCAIAVVGVLVLVWHERRVETTIIPFRLFLQRHVSIAMVLACNVGALMLGVLSYTPLYVQGVLGRTPSEAGSVATPMLIGWPLASYIIGRQLKRIGFRKPVLIGATFILIGALILAVFAPHTTATWPWWLSTFTLGTGMGMTTISITVSLQSSVAWRERGSITALSMFIRSMGAALAVGGMGALLAARLSTMMDPELIGPLLSHTRSSALAVNTDAAHALAVSFTPWFWTIVAFAALNFCAAVAYHPKQ